MAKWTAADMPTQVGRKVLITGANSGLGRQSALDLAKAGAQVILACRSLDKAQPVVDEIARSGGSAQLLQLDLSDLSSVRKAADEIKSAHPDGIDVLVNNAGVMYPPKSRTAQGFELQFGTNHLGHAALTWLLLPVLRQRQGARVVTLSSIAANQPGFDIDDLNFERRGYNPYFAYNTSKLSNLIFAVELDRRLRAAGDSVISVAAHPGMTDTPLFSTGVSMEGQNKIFAAVTTYGAKLVTQPVSRGALPQLYAASAPGVQGGQYFGPDGIREIRGYPKLTKPRGTALKPDIGRRLWEITAELTGVTPDPE
ncbi:SDR family NAD(P)-dependent oxidoreductase [Pseudonocardiaceae bacterium YIM PH 21723]|nr:SDR family NAD(P)-dependent oxidoreductase [Pseudonocardiaceae bacterium YIM PH 21723]